MKLRVYGVDMRGGYGEPVEWETDVIDEDTGDKVGFVKNERSPANRHISLFAGKYQGDLKTLDQCEAFAKGVEAVLNHMTARGEEGQERASPKAA